VENLRKGKFYGNSSQQFLVNGLTIVNSSFYQYDFCPWHYHQNAHFAFTTHGTLIETHKKGNIRLAPGSLLYNHSLEPHCNSHYAEDVAALHVDIDESWFNQYEIDFVKVSGVRELASPFLKSSFYSIFRELHSFDSASPLAIETLLIQCLNNMIRSNTIFGGRLPSWVARVNDLLYDRYNEQILLKEIAAEVNIHPVYLCQQFSHYFRCSFGEYIRKIRIEKAVGFILGKGRASLTEIAFACGFADQSHFIRTFKRNIGVTPMVFRKMAAR
jgi:AraC family transcriptional regulator